MLMATFIKRFSILDNQFVILFTEMFLIGNSNAPSDSFLGRKK